MRDGWKDIDGNRHGERVKGEEIREQRAKTKDRHIGRESEWEKLRRKENEKDRGEMDGKAYRKTLRRRHRIEKTQRGETLGSLKYRDKGRLL